jgi:hypothetical protein
MQKLNFDLGLKEYEIGGGVLRFNPSDPNVYARFAEAGKRMTAIEEKLVAKANSTGAEVPGEVMLALMTEADRETKETLAWVFGGQNDFDAIFCGTNVMGVGSNGERIITNFVHAIKPIMEAGARKCAGQQVQEAVKNARKNRAQRRAEARK